MEHGMERGKRYRRWSWEDKRRAVERMKTVSSQELAEELGIHKRQLYEWRDQLRQHRGEPPTREEQLRRENQQLRAALGRKARKWISCKVPCEESRLDARPATALAKLHLRR